jgi:hypothetical protein
VGNLLQLKLVLDDLLRLAQSSVDVGGLVIQPPQDSFESLFWRFASDTCHGQVNENCALKARRGTNKLSTLLTNLLIPNTILTILFI